MNRLRNGEWKFIINLPLV